MFDYLVVWLVGYMEWKQITQSLSKKIAIRVLAPTAMDFTLWCGDLIKLLLKSSTVVQEKDVENIWGQHVDT